jgi:hypothetical protein
MEPGNQRSVQASENGQIQIEMNGLETTRLPAGQCEFPVHAPPPPHLALLVLKKNMLKKTIRCVVRRL